jgi:hypothetical protein
MTWQLNDWEITDVRTGEIETLIGILIRKTQPIYFPFYFTTFSPVRRTCTYTERMKEVKAFFFVIIQTRCTNCTHLFCHETLHVSDSSSVHHQEFIHCKLSNGICHTGFQQHQDGTAVPSWSCSKPVWHIPLLSVQWINSWWWTEELSETCRVSWQNKFVQLVHLVGFIIKKFVTMRGHMNVEK